MATKTKVKIVLSTLLITGIVACAMYGVRVSVGPATAAAATFDHSNCQYPDRWSNPENGCDNSDPAVPECIKGMSTKESEQACIDAFVAAHSCAGYPNGVCESCTIGQCTGKDATPPDPNRDYYDGAGNLYDYQGNLKQAAPTGAVAPSSCTGK